MREPELKLAKQLIEQIASETFDPTQYEDDVRKRIQADIERKVEGQEIAAGAEPRARAGAHHRPHGGAQGQPRQERRRRRRGGAGRLRAYVRAGLLSAERGERGELRFSFQDLLLLRTAEGLVAERIPPAPRGLGAAQAARAAARGAAPHGRAAVSRRRARRRRATATRAGSRDSGRSCSSFPDGKRSGAGDAPGAR